MNIFKSFILVISFVSIDAFSHETNTSCVDFFFGDGNVRIDWEGTNPGSPKHKNGQVEFNITRNVSSGVVSFIGFFQAKKGHKWVISKGEINGESFDFTTTKNARDNTAGLTGGGSCTSTSAKGDFRYYGEGPGLSFTFTMYKQ